jgi:hypothetical protein
MKLISHFVSLSGTRDSKLSGKIIEQNANIRVNSGGEVGKAELVWTRCSK